MPGDGWVSGLCVVEVGQGHDLQVESDALGDQPEGEGVADRRRPLREGVVGERGDEDRVRRGQDVGLRGGLYCQRTGWPVSSSRASISPSASSVSCRWAEGVRIRQTSQPTRLAARIGTSRRQASGAAGRRRRAGTGFDSWSRTQSTAISEATQATFGAADSQQAQVLDNALRPGSIHDLLGSELLRLQERVNGIRALSGLLLADRSGEAERWTGCVWIGGRFRHVGRPRRLDLRPGAESTDSAPGRQSRLPVASSRPRSGA